MGLIQKIGKMLPNKLTASQRADVKLAKLNQKAGKTAIKEAGKTIRNVVSNIAANRTVQSKMAYDAQAKYRDKVADNSAVERALDVYENIIKGSPDQTGGKGTESTTEVGSSGSKLNG